MLINSSWTLQDVCYMFLSSVAGPLSHLTNDDEELLYFVKAAHTSGVDSSHNLMTLDST